MDEEEPSLPKLVSHSYNESLPLNLRKRTRLSSPSISLSSDPPIFSSDDDPSADNYTNVRRKKIYRGPWYHHELIDGREKPKRTLKRQLDSGIWMGSDEADVGDVEPNLEEISRSKVGIRVQPEKPLMPSPEELAEKHIELCLDKGNESIELMNYDLTTLSSKAIKLLSTFAYAHSTPEAFQPLDPKLKLLLSTNNIVRVPGEIYNLQHLHVLTLRANEIKELSPAISQLQNLVELNIANNSLRYLPFEILELFKESSPLREFHIHPNPFYEPDIPTPEILPAITQEEIPSSPKLCDTPTTKDQKHWRTLYCFSSPVRYFYANGKLAKGPKIPTDDGEPSSLPTSALQSNLNTASKKSTYPGVRKSSSLNSAKKLTVAKLDDVQLPPENTVSAAPSLLELCLQTCYDSAELPYLTNLEYPGMPSYVPDLFKKALLLKEDGGQKCTVCGRKFVITRVEWIEWWEIAKPVNRKISTASAASPLRGWENPTGRDRIEAMVPLIRRGCSWKCYKPTTPDH